MNKERRDIARLLEDIMPAARIKARLIDRVAYASDAGFYRLEPQAVVQPASEEEIKELFRFSHYHNIPLTFRAAGTSLSGQSITDGILVDISQYWRKISIEAQGETIRLQPGVTGAMANAHLRPYRRKIGPDPASINSAMMGGILSNNASGMCCGVSRNSYHTTQYIRFMLPDGNVFSTENKEDYHRFAVECEEVHTVLSVLRDRITSDTALYDRIRSKYKTKNTVGYSLNAFIDFFDPLDILAHLLIGGEGTLGFISEVVMRTVPDYPAKSTALLYFPDIYAACSAIVPLAETGAEAVELMDRASLRSVEDVEGVPGVLKTLPNTAAALLVEYQGNNQQELFEKTTLFLTLAPRLSLLYEPVFTTNATEQAFLWKIRKGLFPAVGAIRASGTTVILEDVAFPIQKLGDAIRDLQDLFQKHNYSNAIIFGHAKDGNIHFVVTQALNTGAEISRYERFMQDVVDLVVNKYDGALKAEHGTGRNMAPFVETEWGGALYNIMKELKMVIDPLNLLNPGVIINSDNKAHIRNLKRLAPVEEEVDKCMECGFCEHRCPSRDITLTPRRRIMVRRELKQLECEGNRKAYAELLLQYRYDGLDTCAVDGLCALACPVGINMGSLVKQLRKDDRGRFANGVAILIAKNFAPVVSTVKGGIQAAVMVNKLLGKNSLLKLTRAMNKLVPGFPVWTNQVRPSEAFRRHIMPNGNTARATSVVYFPACISRSMGGSADGNVSIIDAFMSVAAKAGVTLEIPKDIHSSCCGQLFSSKGFTKAFAVMANETVEKLWRWTGGGERPVVLDVTSCTYTLKQCRPVLTEANQKKFDRLKILDSIDFMLDYLLPSITVLRKKGQVVLHPVCAVHKMGLEGKLLKIANSLADNVDVPLHAGCCGMAGDRGFWYPEFTRSATKLEAEEVRQKEYDGYYSTAKTCEMNLSDAVGKNYESLVYLLDECT